MESCNEHFSQIQKLFSLLCTNAKLETRYWQVKELSEEQKARVRQMSSPAQMDVQAWLDFACCLALTCCTVHTYKYIYIYIYIIFQKPNNEWICKYGNTNLHMYVYIDF